MPYEKRTLLAGSHPPALRGARPVGAPAPQDRIEVGLHLRYKESSGGLPSLEELSATPLKERQYLSHQEFESLHGADPADVERVKAFAREHHLDVVDVNLAHRMVKLAGTVANISAAFGIYLVHYEHEEGNFRGHEGPVYVPEELVAIVQGVFGLNNRPVARPHIYYEVENVNFSSFDGKFYPNQLADIYNFPGDVAGSGQSIAIVELGGGYRRNVLQNYFENVVNVQMPQITSVAVGNGYNNPEDPSGADTEVYLDIEVVGAIAPRAQMVAYFSTSDEYGFLQAVKQAVHDPSHNNSVISISWGSPEDFSSETFRNAMNQTLQEAVVKGITVCVAAGDHGSSDQYPPNRHDRWAHVDFPASSPFALACGGSKLVASGNNIQSEVVWNDNYGWATGGWSQQVFPRSLIPRKCQDSRVGKSWRR